LVYSDFYIFRQTTRQKFLSWMIASITQIKSLNFLLNQMFIFTVIPKYLNRATFSKDPLAISVPFFSPTSWWWESNVLVFKANLQFGYIRPVSPGWFGRLLVSLNEVLGTIGHVACGYMAV
jgi:hypothetical protein